MAIQKSKGNEPILTIELGKGLAERNRLPLSTVLRFLNEFRSLMVAIGREIQASKGVKDPTGDFGLEIIANGSGGLFSKGSVGAKIAITRDHEVGVLAAQTVLSTLQRLNQTARKPVGTVAKLMPLQARVVPYLDRMAFISSASKSEAKFSLSKVAQTARAPVRGILGEAAVHQLREYRPKPVFVEHGVVAYGKLYELKDMSREPTEEGSVFWGELRLENGQRWRIQFKNAMENDVAPLFRKQVCLIGDAHYFQHRSTKLIASRATLDEVRDYEAAFDELWGSERGTLGQGTFQSTLDMRYGE